MKIQGEARQRFVLFTGSSYYIILSFSVPQTTAWPKAQREVLIFWLSLRISVSGMWIWTTQHKYDSYLGILRSSSANDTMQYEDNQKNPASKKKREI